MKVFDNIIQFEHSYTARGHKMVAKIWTQQDDLILKWIGVFWSGGENNSKRSMLSPSKSSSESVIKAATRWRQPQQMLDHYDKNQKVTSRVWRSEVQDIHNLGPINSRSAAEPWVASFWMRDKNFLNLQIVKRDQSSYLGEQKLYHLRILQQSKRTMQYKSRRTRSKRRHKDRFLLHTRI